MRARPWRWTEAVRGLWLTVVVLGLTVVGMRTLAWLLEHR